MRGFIAITMGRPIVMAIWLHSLPVNCNAGISWAVWDVNSDLSATFGSHLNRHGCWRRASIVTSESGNDLF
ncbi:TPA: hypothetical protein ACNEGM_000208 [Escherichia coli]|uniref:hypothetical protein n=1 Tax=Escherichia coli TaxID=562 RepID=UPI000F66209A|nr:hypothetical protein [Escherichia coli]HDW3846149.1 hypothetical protein [Escherichia coli O100:H12]EFK6054103.1 hypothetical protein [Escherichia coli]EGO3545161.1 hypothetical protein [Escherichia coli]EGO3601689.1 hypothetical protein [Escherichia coli]EJE5526998.1 hypothetical protein [Escherichia coli]